MSKPLKFIILILSIFLSVNSFSQSETSNSKLYFGGLNINNGYVWPHTSRVYYIKANAIAIQAKAYLNLTNTNDWTNPYKATKFGYSFTYIKTTNLNTEINPDNKKLGDIYGLNIFLEPMLFSYKRLHLYAHLGAGIAYASEKYNRASNDSNLLISTPLSFFFNGKINLDYELTNKFSIGLNFGMSHCSNAAIYLPNLGMNVVNYGINFGYKIFTKEQHNLKIIKTEPYWNKNISLGYATRNCNENISKYYHIFTADFELSRHLNLKNAVSFNFNYLLRQGEMLDKTFVSTYNSYYGLALGHELFIKKLSLISQLGAYVYDTDRNKHFWYARLGVRYYFLPNFYSSILLTNRKQSADLLQIAFGFSFK